MTPLPPRSTLFPYTTLFRSQPDVSLNFPLNFWATVSNTRVEVVPTAIIFFPSCFALFRTWALFSLSRSEEHTSELQSRGHLVCRLLLEKKNNHITLSSHKQE